MNRLQRAAVLAELADKLTAHGSWCGETQVQKAVYLLQELLNARLDYDFILYKHGPFSFDLRDDLTGLRADGLFELQSRHTSYGPTLVTTPAVHRVKDTFKVTMSRFSKPVEFIAAAVGDKGVVELERLGTALYVTREDASRTRVEERAARLCELKPHVTLQTAHWMTSLWQAVQHVAPNGVEARRLRRVLGASTFLGRRYRRAAGRSVDALMRSLVRHDS